MKAAVDEGRVLVTMDLDFGNVVTYPPERTNGILIVHLPGRASLPVMLMLVREALAVQVKETIRGRLWIVEPGRIRVHEPDEILGRKENE